MDLNQQNIGWYNYAGNFKKGDTADWSLAAFSILSDIAEETQKSEPAAQGGAAPDPNHTVRIPWWAVRVLAHRWRTLIESHRVAGKDEFALSLDTAFGFRKNRKGARPRVRQYLAQSDEICFAMDVARVLEGKLKNPPRGAVGRAIEREAKARHWGIERATKAWKRYKPRILHQLEKYPLPASKVRS